MNHEDVNIPPIDGIPSQPNFNIKITKRHDPTQILVEFTDLLFYINGDWVSGKTYTIKNAKAMTKAYMKSPKGFDIPYKNGLYSIIIN